MQAYWSSQRYGQVDSQVDLKRLVMKLTVPENFDSDATTYRLDPTWKAQVDLGRPDSQVYVRALT